ncbi:MAG: GNAT family N-acetyltransferase [Phototrophicaceae bacterium]
MAIVTLGHTSRELVALQDEWGGLLERSRAHRAFHSWHWITTWWQFHLNDVELWLLVARDEQDGRLIGAAPLVLREVHPTKKVPITWRQLEMMVADEVLYHRDFVIETGREAEVLPLFLELLLAEQERWDVLRFANLSPFSNCVPLLSEQPHIDWDHRAGASFPYLALPQDWTGYHKRLSKATRHQLSQIDHKVEAQIGDDWAFEIIDDPQQLSAILLQLRHFQHVQFQVDQVPVTFYDNITTRFYFKVAKRLFTQGGMRVFVLRFHDEVAAILWVFVQQHTLSCFSFGQHQKFVQYDTETLLIEQAIRYAIGTFMHQIEFMAWDHGMPLDFGTEILTPHDFTWYRAKKASMLRQAVELGRASKERTQQMLETVRARLLGEDITLADLSDTDWKDPF